MVLIPAGTFSMGESGSRADETPHQVSVSAFSLDKTRKRDRKAAFHKAFKTAGLAAKSTHTAKAKVRLRPAKGRGKRTTKKLKGSFSIC